MILDFVKLFPKSCAQNNITSFLVNLDDIKCFQRLYDHEKGFNENSSVDFIQIGKEQYCFPPFDDGLIILSAIFSAQNLIELLNANDESLTNERASAEKDICENYLRECTIKYGATP